MIGFSLDEMMGGEPVTVGDFQPFSHLDGKEAAVPKTLDDPRLCKVNADNAVAKVKQRIDDPILRRAIYHLLWVWAQYDRNSTLGEGKSGNALEHRNMCAGEDATEFLQALGLGRDQGYQFEINAAGLEIFNDETLRDYWRHDRPCTEWTSSVKDPE